MTIYNWTIQLCEHEVATGGITVAHWRCYAQDGDYTADARAAYAATQEGTQ